MSGVKNKVVSQEEWLNARVEHLKQEKEFTRQRDALSKSRRDLPWVKIDKDYQFQTSEGEKSLSDLFGTRSQLIVQHFMFAPDWEEGCTSCSFWADGYDGFQVHLANRDATMVSVSNAPLDKLHAYRDRMGWSFDWVSSFGGDFNHDFNVSFTAEQIEQETGTYNYSPSRFPMSEAPGISIFYKNDQGEVFHTYSCFSRGLDMLNAAYHYMDLLPKGRYENELAHSMAWLKRHDQYED